MYSNSELQPGALSSSLHQQVFLLHVVVFVLLRVLQENLVQLFGVDVRVEGGHDREDDANAQQEAGKQQELFPLRKYHQFK